MARTPKTKPVTAAKTATIATKAKPKAKAPLEAEAKGKAPSKAQTEATTKPPKSQKKKWKTVTERALESDEKYGSITEVSPGRRPKNGGNYKGGPGGAVTSDAEQLFRLRIVEQAIIDGKRGGQIVEELKKHGRVLTYNTAAMYMRRVRDKWALEDSLLRPIWRERQMRKLHDVAERLERGGYWGHWVSVQKLIADLEGNLAPVKVEHRQVEEFEGWTVEELETYVESKGQIRPARALEGSRAVGSGHGAWEEATGPGSDSLH